MIPYVKYLKDFHEKYNHTIRERPQLTNFKDNNLRIKLIEEEVNNELIPALVRNNDLTEIADAIADSLVVIFGTAVCYGIPIDEIFCEVMRSNMTKSQEKNEYGKTIKGEDFEPPQIEFILEQYK